MLTDTELFILDDCHCSVMAAYKKHLIQTNNKDLLNVVNLYADIETYCNIESGPQSEKKKEEQAALISRSVRVCHCLSRRVITGKKIPVVYEEKKK